MTIARLAATARDLGVRAAQPMFPRRRRARALGTRDQETTRWSIAGSDARATATFGGTNEFFRRWGRTDVAEATRLVDICREAGVTLYPYRRRLGFASRNPPPTAW